MKKPEKFVNLHAHTGKSIYDGLGDPEEHLEFAFENGMDAMAITDHGNMNAFSHAFLHAKKMADKGKSMKYIPGVEAYYHPDLEGWRKMAQERKEAAEEAKRESKKVDRSQTLSEGDVVSENESETKDVSKWNDPFTRRNHLVLLAKSPKGLENVFSMVSRSQMEGFYRYPRIDAKMLKEHGEDVVVSTACLGGVTSYGVISRFSGVAFDDLHPSLLDDPVKMREAILAIENEIDPLIDAVGRENFFVEIQFNNLSAQHLVNRAMIEVSKKNGLPLVATADSHYHRPDFWQEREMYKLLGRMKFSDFDPSKLPSDRSQLKCELYPKNAEQMWDAYKSYTEGHTFYDDEIVSRSIETSWHIAHDLIARPEPDRGLKLPSGLTKDGMDPFQALLEAVKEGLVRRGFQNDNRYLKRAKMELVVIRDKKVAPYFLAMKMITDIAKSAMWTGVARGSGGGCLINYLIGITDLDPIKYDLNFSRFISHARQDLPDVDYDIADRDRLIDDLKNHFGNERVVPISNFNTLKFKSLIKDVSRFHSVPFEEVNAMTSQMEREVLPVLKSQERLLDDLRVEDVEQHSPTYNEFISKYPDIAKPLKVLFKQQKAVGRHAGGVLITDDPWRYMPLISVPRKGGGREYQTPWIEGQTAKHLEPFGFVKFDCLGLNTLKLFMRAAQLIVTRHVKSGEVALVSPARKSKTIPYETKIEGVSVRDMTDAQLCEHYDFPPELTQVYRYTNAGKWEDVRAWLNGHIHPDAIDTDRPEVYKYVFHEGRFSGIFQYSEKGVQRMIKSFKPMAIIDLAAATAIYRPGPLGANVDKLYLEALQTGKLGVMDHPALEKVLSPTLGYCLFQEQVMDISVELSGFTSVESDKFRKAITKKVAAPKTGEKKDEALVLQEKFIEGALANGYPLERAKQVFETLKYFSQYGFNKCCHGDTLVVANGVRTRMRDVLPGSKVRSRDEKTGKDIDVTVRAVHKNGKKKLHKVTLESGATFVVTMDHKFRVEETGEMLPLHEIISKNLTIVEKK